MIAIILGTRAELIKTFPLMLELERRKKPYIFIHTGQHGLGKLCEEFGVKKPDVVLSKPPEKTTKFWTKVGKAIAWNLAIIPRIKLSLRKIEGLKFVIYHGDTMSTASAAIASSEFLNPFKSWMNVHLEAGLRSGSLLEPFPEEISRRIVTLFSDILFAPSEIAAKNLRGRKHVYQVGNTIVDSILLSIKLAERRGYKSPKGKYALMTIHRYENIKNEKRLAKIVEILRHSPITTYWPMHDNTRKQLEKFGLMEKVKKMKHVRITRLKTYVEFSLWLKNAKFLITDGGSIQEESLTLKKPCILLRKRTERVAGLYTGINFLTGLDVEYARKLLHEVVDMKIPKFKNPYGDGKARKKIVDILEGLE